MGSNKLIFGILFGILAIGISSSQVVFADPGEAEFRTGSNDGFDKASTRALELVEPEPIGVTFFGNGGHSADAIGSFSRAGIVSADVPAGSTVEQAYVYVPKFGSCFGSPTNTIKLDGQTVTVDFLENTGGLCAYRADVTSLVAAKVGSGGGITDFTADYSTAPSADGVGLVVIYSNPALPEVSIAILDGAQATGGDTFFLGLAEPLDKTVPGFSAIMSLGIGFGFQGVGTGSNCGPGSNQASTIDINGERLTSCAGNYDDGVAQDGALITIGGIGDNTDNPSDPFQTPATPGLPRDNEDELYDISSFLTSGDTLITINTRNPSNNDIIFLAIIEITAKASVGEICGDGIDNDDDGLIDEGCDAEQPVCTEYDFNDSTEGELPPNWSGAGSVESVQGYTEDGFDGDFLRNTSGGSPRGTPGDKTTLTLNNLPAHSTIDIGFLLAIIDSWDGSANSQFAPDFFNVVVDEETIFSETFEGPLGPASYDPPEGVEITFREHRGFNNGWRDSSYNMTNDPTFQNIPHTASNVTIDFFASGAGWQGGGDESWAIENVAIGLDNGCAVPEVEEKKTGGGDNQWDTRPSFGISHETRQDQIVENGFSFNSEYFTLTDNHWTDFAEQSIEIGMVNTFSATVWADKGLKIQEFLFGIPNVGESHLAEFGVEIWYNINGEIEDVIVVQNSHVIDADTISVSHEKTKCLATDAEAKCDTTTVSMTFLEPLQDKVMAIKAIDWKNRDQRTYLNDGFDISGKSLNPMLAKMIPSTVRDEGLLKVTQVAKYSPYWVTDDDRIFEMNNFGSFKQINQSFERFQDTGTAYTRMHSGFGGIIAYEQNRALDIFDASNLVSELPASFTFIYPETGQRISDKMREAMLLQEQIAEGILDEMDRQDRHY